MNQPTTNACTRFDPNALLDESQSDDWIQEMQAHLESCETCQDKLLDAAGGPAWIDTIQAHDPTRRELDAKNTAERPNAGSIVLEQLASAEPASDSAEQLLSFLHPTDDPQSLGRIGPYEVTGIVGQGGMGIVMKARDPALGRFVAVKVLHPLLAADGTSRKRFASEAKAAAAVTHDNVIPVHSVDMQGDLPYFVMPLIRGESLEQRLNHNGPFDLVEILRIATQIASGLSAAHAQGLIHRDIKPANILLDAGTQRLTITDFGLARAIDDVAATRQGVIAGTPQFMSPEQTIGARIDERSDLFSLGSVIYTIATGRPPFRGDNSHVVMERLARQDPPPMRQTRPELPDWLDRLVRKLMAKAPDDRPENAATVARMMQACLAHVQHSDRSLPAELSSSRRASSRFKLLTFTCASILVTAALIAFTAFSERPTVDMDSSSKRLGQDQPSIQPQVPFDWSSEWTAPFDDLQQEMSRLERDFNSDAPHHPQK